jgi:hypothetical protein
MISAYPAQMSYRPGEAVSFRCSTDARSFSADVFREGETPALVWRMEDCTGRSQATPADAAANGCGWEETFTVPTSHEWPSGFYLVILRANSPSDEEDVAHSFFVLRPDGERPQSPILLVLSTNTYNAYNNWGGPSLYDGGVRVSFERPLAKGLLHKPEPAVRLANMSSAVDRDLEAFHTWADKHGLSRWCGAAGWYNWERPFLRWAAGEGFPLDVATNADLEFHPEILGKHRAVVSVGHDEYWSWGMRDALESFIASGGNAAFFSGNDVSWQVRFEDNGRSMVSHKYNYQDDPVLGTDQERLVTSLWCDNLIARPENRLTGVSFSRGGYVRFGLGVPQGSGGYTVWRPEHWAFDGTDLRYGDLLGAQAVVVGYEADGCEFVVEDGLPIPTCADGTPETFTILASSPAHLWSTEEQPARFSGEIGDLQHTADRLFGAATPENVARIAHGNAVMGAYTNGGTVFTTGCTDWAYGIAARDPAIAQVTANVLKRLSS